MKLYSELGTVIVIVGLFVLFSFLEKQTTTTVSEWQQEILQQSPPASRNPPMDMVSRCFKLYPTGEEGEQRFQARVNLAVKSWIEKGRGILRVRDFPASNDGLFWRRGDTQFVVIYFKE